MILGIILICIGSLILIFGCTIGIALSCKDSIWDGIKWGVIFLLICIAVVGMVCLIYYGITLIEGSKG